ncbi:uncharacterized protein DUF2236 [Acidovorax sp. 62]|uniref:oxygenase MpaB family protein n=2 Tax=unclassified Acidovorax TaxID=2684926 RepID=UPI000C176B9C|nr:oxygenase MpaB family protein [Acidovorax sp. 62]PIF90035.1 uncharacterized protein DUF2236 [Acidovorax sp. 62]
MNPRLRAANEAELNAMQLDTDPLADDTIARILGPWPAGMPAPDASQWQAIGTVNRLFAQWNSNAALHQWRPEGEGIAPALAQALQDYVAAGQVLPSWADHRKIERAEQLFMEHGALSCILLFCASLPECYVIPDLSSVLHTAGQLEQHTEHRIRSTAAMIFPVMLHGGLTQPGGTGIAQVLKVRLIHATIRNLILRGNPQDARHRIRGDGLLPALPLAAATPPTMHQALYARGWNLLEQGAPCNQEELAYTLLTFGYVFLRSMRRLGIGLPPADEEAYLHAWNVVGHVLGIDSALMVHNMHQGESLMEQMQTRGRARPVAPDPRPALGTALMQTMAHAIPWKLAKPFPPLMTRYLCGPQTAQDLALQQQPVPWLSRAVFWGVLMTARVIDATVRVVLPEFSIVRALTRVLGYHFMSRVLMGQTRPLQLPDQLLGQMDDAMARWSDDPRAPGWLNRLEDRLTTPGRWKLGRRTVSPANA